MGDTRIDNSKPYVPPGCDEETGVCGRVNEPEPQISRDLSETESHVGGSDWHAPMLPEDKPKPSHVAQIAENMATPKPPTDSELRAPYEKMSDAELEKEVNTLSKRLSGGDQYSGAALDTRKFHVAEAVAKTRADAARPRPEGEYTKHLLPNFDEAMHRGDTFTVMHGSTEWSIDHIGIQGTMLHAQWKKDLGFMDIAASGDAASAGLDEGFHNVDGSTGIHASGGAIALGGEVTLHKTGIGSVTLGASAGASAEVSVGVKKEGKTEQLCVRAGFEIVTVGACFPIARRM